MGKVILVDDEKLIRQELLVMVDWKSHGFEVIVKQAMEERLYCCIRIYGLILWSLIFVCLI